MSDEIPMNENEQAAEVDAETDIAREAEAEELELEAEAEEQEQEGEPDPADEIRDLKDKLLRAMAESENTRRIAAREKQDASKYAVTNFARDILRVADNLGFAMMSVTEEARKADSNLDNLYVGIDMTMKELLSVFEGQGIKPVPAVGEAFDHNIHEAVQQVENPDVAAGTVMQALRGGFTIQDRLLRPAQVIVSTGGPTPDGADRAAEGEAQVPGGADAYEAGAAEPGKNVDQET